jgi:hypothetical protein
LDVADTNDAHAIATADDKRCVGGHWPISHACGARVTFTSANVLYEMNHRACSRSHIAHRAQH